MRILKDFEEYLKTGTAKKRNPDKSRARSLLEEAQRRMRFLDEISRKVGLDDENANYFIENAYDILIELIRGRMLLDGYYASGEGAHEAEVSYMRRLNLPEKDARFMNNLRYYRNGILYYGKNFDSEYGKKVLDFLKRLYHLLLQRKN